MQMTRLSLRVLYFWRTKTRLYYTVCSIRCANCYCMLTPARVSNKMKTPQRKNRWSWWLKHSFICYRNSNQSYSRTYTSCMRKYAIHGGQKHVYRSSIYYRKVECFSLSMHRACRAIFAHYSMPINHGDITRQTQYSYINLNETFWPTSHAISNAVLYSIAYYMPQTSQSPFDVKLYAFVVVLNTKIYLLQCVHLSTMRAT